MHVRAAGNEIADLGAAQSFQGSAFVGSQAGAEARAASFARVVVDGARGTVAGYGLVQGLMFGDYLCCELLLLALL